MTKQITYKFDTILEVYKSYMPFLLKGGIFIKTDANHSVIYEMNEEIECHITLPNNSDEFIVKGKIKWITPTPVNEGFTPGIGIHFTKNHEDLVNAIEQAIAGGAGLNSNRTYTI